MFLHLASRCQCLGVPSADVTVVPAIDRHLTLRRLAVGLLQYYERLEDPSNSRAAYPQHLQRALDELSWEAFRVGAEAPTSAVALMQWAEQPLGDWPAPLVDQDADEAFDTLLSFGAPTDACDELGALRGDIAADARESATIDAVRSACQRADRPDAYVAFREFLIRNPLIEKFALDGFKLDPKFRLISEEVAAAYETPRPEWVADGTIHSCRNCGNALRVRPGERQRVCVEPLCTHQSRGGKEYRLAQTLVLRRDLRKFVAGPGHAEIRIADKVKRKGLPFNLWPDYDAYDLRVFEERFWAVDVKAWRSPARLAYHLAERPPRRPEGAERFMIVVANELATDGYMSTLATMCAEAGGISAELLSEKQLLKEIATSANVRSAR